MTPELDGTFPVRNLRMLGPETMQFDETGRQSELITVTVARINGKFRSWHSVRANGTVLIAAASREAATPRPPSRSARRFCRRSAYLLWVAWA